MLRTLFSLMDEYFMLPFGSIRSLQFQSYNCGSAVYMLLLMLTKLFSLIDKGFMLPICSHIINSGSVTIVNILFILTVFSTVPQIYISSDLSTHTHLYI